MRKALMGATLATLAATSTAVFADDPVGTTTTAPAPPAPAAASPTPPAGGVPAPAAAPAPGVIPPPVSTTTVTAAPAVGASPASTQPSERDTVTLHQKIRPNRPLLYTGGVLLLGAYVPTAVLTATEDQDRSLYIPVVGPWMHLADRDSGEDTGEAVLIAASGIVQGAGAILMTASLFVPEKIPAATIQAGNVKINLSPTSYGRGSAGLGAVGRF